MTIRAIIYARFSPRRDEEKSESIAVQLTYCRVYCKQRGYEVAGEHSDKAISGSEIDRPGLWQAIGAIHRGDVLVAHKPDRLARDVYLSELVHREVAKRKGRVEAVEGGANGDSPQDVMLRQVLSAFAEMERKGIAARTKAAMLYHQKQGRRMGGPPPYGWKVDPNTPTRLAENYQEQTILKRILADRARGKTLQEIVDGLEDDDVEPRGEHWHKSTIMRLLRREGL